MEDAGFDTTIKGLLDDAYKAAMVINANNSFTADEVRMMILITNLQSLVKAILTADAEPEVHTLDLKQVALGLMGAIDFASEGISK